jgi:group I intron endonuclease
MDLDPERQMGFYLMVGIYKIESPSGKIYIGQSVNIYKRLSGYRSINCIKQTKLYRSLLKYGYDSHILSILEECSVHDLNDRERYWQDFYESVGLNGLNCRLQSSFNLSGYLSEDTKDKIRKNRKGIKSKFKDDKSRIEKIKIALTGKKLSDNHKMSLSISHKGIKMSEETKEKKRIKMTGYKFGDEFKKKMSCIQTGENNSYARMILNLETGIYYMTVKEAAESIGWTSNRFSHYINGRTKRKIPFIKVHS